MIHNGIQRVKTLISKLKNKIRYEDKAIPVKGRGVP
jgi:hypothetical protein